MNAAHLVAYEVLNQDLVPLVVPTVSLGATIAIVAVVLYFRYRGQQLRQDLYKAFLDKGEPIPAALMAGKVREGNADLRRGLVLLLGGSGICASLLLAHLSEVAAFGLIPALIGVAYLLVWKLEARKSGESAQG